MIKFVISLLETPRSISFDKRQKADCKVCFLSSQDKCTSKKYKFIIFFLKLLDLENSSNEDKTNEVDISEFLNNYEQNSKLLP